MTDQEKSTLQDWDAIDALYAKARQAEANNEAETAIAHYRDILAQDPDDHLGVCLSLGPLSRNTPDKAPSAYVATLFDQNAEIFDSILVDELGYGVPLLIADGLTKLEAGPFQNWLDLGCGTGLCAMALEDMTSARTGIDLAPTMVEIADELELYQHLFVGEAVQFLQGKSPLGPYDLITAADVLPYLGDLEPMFSAMGHHVQKGSYLAFSSELLDDETKTYNVGTHKRFAHSSSYLLQILSQFGWQVLACDTITVRLEQDDPVAGELIIAQKG